MLSDSETKFEVSSVLNAEDSLPEQVFALACDLSEVRMSLDAKYASLHDSQESNTGLLSSREKQVRADSQDRLQRIFTAMVDLRIIENHLLDVAQGLEEGRISEQAVFNTFPVKFTEIPRQAKLSKRKQAIAEQQARETRLISKDKDHNTFIDPVFTRNNWAIFGDLSPLAPAPTGTDPRRIASGRHQTKLNAGSGMSSTEAEDAFMHVTADTHGGKTRNFGKNGKRYVGKSGRRIRKK